eukprot:jgi/Mesvir1/24344/Mv11022-RA.1
MITLPCVWAPSAFCHYPARLFRRRQRLLQPISRSNFNIRACVMSAVQEACASNADAVTAPSTGVTEPKRKATKQERRDAIKAATCAGYDIEGISIGGQETCIILDQLKVAFDSGRCPQRCVFQPTLLLTHAHLDHVGGVPFYVATRSLLGLSPPTLIVPPAVAPALARLMEVHRELDQSELKHTLVPLEIGSEYALGKDWVVKPFPTYHTVPSQGYLIYNRRRKLKPEYLGLPGKEIQALRASGVEVSVTVDVPEVAFTGDTTPEFILDARNADVLRARLLVMEMTFVDDSVTVEQAVETGHTHIDQIVELADRFQNEGILFIHFSARYRREDIMANLEGKLPPRLLKRVVPYLEGFANKTPE